MYSWEIEKIEEIPEKEQKEYCDKLISRYNNELKDLKSAKKASNAKAIGSCAWRIGLIATAIAALAGPLMAAFGTGAVNLAGEIMSVSSIGLFGASMLGSTISNDDGPKDIKMELEASKDATNKIREINKKINIVQSKQKMGKR